MNKLMYVLFFAGCLVLLSDEFFLIRRRIQLKKKYRVKAKSKLDPLLDYFSKLIGASLGKSTDGKAFLFMEIALFFIAFSVIIRAMYFIQSFCLALLFSLLPVGLLTLKLKTEQSKSSLEGIQFIGELSRRYKIENYNIVEALDSSLTETEGLVSLRKPIYRLVLHLRSAAREEDVSYAVEEFAFSIGTLWADMLANSIRMAVQKGMDISASLDDISMQLVSAVKRNEERKRINSEASRMVTMLIPILYVGSFFAGIKLAGLTLPKLLKNQFATKEGIIFFSICAILFAFNYSINKILSSQKLDC